MSYRKILASEVAKVSKWGHDVKIYDVNNPAMGLVTVKTEEGHFQEYRMKTIDLYFLVLEGSGTFVLDDEKTEVGEGDLLIIKAGTRVHYFGRLKMVLVSTPAFAAEDEEHIRLVEKSESPYV